MPWGFVESVRRGGESLKRLRSGSDAPQPVPVGPSSELVWGLPLETWADVFSEKFRRLQELTGVGLEVPGDFSESTFKLSREQLEAHLDRVVLAVENGLQGTPSQQTQLQQARLEQTPAQPTQHGQAPAAIRLPEAQSQTSSPRPATVSSECHLRQLRQDVDALQQEARRASIVLHAPEGFTHERLMLDLSKVLQSDHCSMPPLLPSALRPMATCSAGSKMWRLRLPDIDTKHAIFSGSKHLRGKHVYLDDDLTRRQLEGRRSLAPRRLELKQQGHVTWWRRDTLCWAQGGSVHKVRPDLVR